eukprot:7350916-Alexandrium_andersonii.AAC.1
MPHLVVSTACQRAGRWHIRRVLGLPRGHAGGAQHERAWSWSAAGCVLFGARQPLAWTPVLWILQDFPSDPARGWADACLQWVGFG